MSLDQAVEKLRKEINTERLSMSIGELATLYEKGELDIHPKFQRFLRWTDAQRTKLVESLLLRIPIPPLFVAQDATGRWDVVDGVQRLGSIFHFMGILKRANGDLYPPLVLQGTKLLPTLDGYTFVAAPRPAKSFTQSQQLDFKRLRLDLQIILKESDPSAKYELFERLNTGGSNASEQEVRNCVLVWMNESLFDWMHDLAESPDFIETVILTDRLEEQQFRLELVLRFLSLYQTPETNLRKLKDLGEFLNEQNRYMAADAKLDRTRHERVFAETFKRIRDAAGTDAFRKFDSTTDRFRSGFLISAFEAVALGVAHNVRLWPARASGKLKARIRGIWGEVEFTNHIGIGVPARERIQHSIPFGRRFFKP